MGAFSSTQASDGVVTFIAGDELVIPFLILAESTIVALTGGVISAEVWWDGVRRFNLTEGSGIEIVNRVPQPDTEDQEPHGLVRISEAQSLTFPYAPTAFLRLVFVDQAGVTMQTAGALLMRTG